MLSICRRARYLRLPTLAPRLTNPSPRSSLALAPTPSRSAIPRRTIDMSEVGPSRSALTQSKPLGARTGIVSLLSSRPRSETAASASRPNYSSLETRELSPTRTQSSIGLHTNPQRQKYTPRSREILERDPARFRPSYGAVREKGTKSKDMDSSPSRPSRSKAPSSAGGDLSRTRLWLELREVQGKSKSKPPTERSRSREPP